MKIAIRLDDITPEMDWPKFHRFRELLDRYGIRPLIGVIPENRDDTVAGSSDGAPADFFQYVRSLRDNGWSVAMHGCYHRYVTKKGGIFPLNDFSEFAGVPYETQRLTLQKGRRILSEKGIDTDLFMAPAHSYDKNTLKALREAGFTKVTDGFGSRPYRMSGLIFYPISFRKSTSLEKKEGFTTFVVHTNTMEERDFTRYEELFEKAAKKGTENDPAASPFEFISYGEYLDAEAKDRGCFGRIREYLQAKIKHFFVKRMRSGS
ncbi:MAG: DUF2334 domain-containing protein [Lachnospiraceae bacterium]|nr:DUF2334 domain-containing protein [Lachnospiraceae bacterium]